MSSGRPPTLWMRLDPRCDSSLAAGLDDVGVERALHEEGHVPQPPCLLLEDADELFADPPPLLLRVGDALEARKKAIGRVDVHERHVEVPAERLDDLNRLVLPQQAVVDEHACQLVSHRTVHEQCRDRGVDTAREPA